MSLDLHPPINAFVLVCIVLAVCFEIVNWFRSSAAVQSMIGVHLVVAACFSILAFITGLQASESASKFFLVSDEDMSAHYDMARLLLFFVIPCPALFYVARNAKNNRLVFSGAYRVCLFICLGLVLYTGYLGGQLVFTHGAGVIGGEVSP